MAIAQTDCSVVKMDNGSALTGLKNVRAVKWSSPSTVAHTCVLTDTAGNEFFSHKCSVAHDGGDLELVGVDVNGITATMGSGYALVYMGNGNYPQLK